MPSRTSGADSAGHQVSVRTTCGREIQIGHLALGGGPHPALRVSLGISAPSDTEDGTWAGLTVDEARQLAAALSAQASACDRWTRTTMVNALTARGMITRASADEDGRAIELTATDAGQQAVHAWQATDAAVLHLALSTLPEPQQRALTAAVPAIDALARAIDRLADTPPADQDPR